MPLSMHPTNEILPMAQQVPLVRVDRPAVEIQVLGKTTTAGVTQPETASTTRSHLLKMIMKNEQQRHSSTVNAISNR